MSGINRLTIFLPSYEYVTSEQSLIYTSSCEFWIRRPEEDGFTASFDLVLTCLPFMTEHEAISRLERFLDQFLEFKRERNHAWFRKQKREDQQGEKTCPLMITRKEKPLEEWSLEPRRAAAESILLIAKTLCVKRTRRLQQEGIQNISSYSVTVWPNQIREYIPHTGSRAHLHPTFPSS